MTTLFLDIDNTLIFSHRHAPEGPKRPAEYLDGRVQSFITERTCAFFSAHRELRTVPVTTRTLPQYRRVEPLLRELGCEYALIGNGALLLRQGESDPDWLAETLRLSGEERGELPKAAQWLEERCGAGAVHPDAGLLVYAAAEEPEALAAGLRQALDPRLVSVLCDARKVYAIPRSLNKGEAVRRFLRRFPASLTIAAGDSDFDLPMLEQADRALLPERLAAKVRNPGKTVAAGASCFSDALCDSLSRLLDPAPFR